MPLHALLTELLLKIAEQLDARTCFKFALTSRNDYSVSSSLLAKHKANFARYNTINTAYAGRLVWDITKEIIETPSLAQYIEAVSLPATRQRAWNPDADLDTLMHSNPAIVPEELVQLFINNAESNPTMKQAMEQCRYDEHFHGPDWVTEQSIRIGSDEPIIALLVALATNIRILRLTQSDDQPELIQLLRCVAGACRYPIKAPYLPFRHLTYAAVSYADTEMSCSAEWTFLFMSIPTLKGFAAK